MISTKDAIMVVIAWPDLMVAPELVEWKSEIGIPRKNVCYMRKHSFNISETFNTAIKLALQMCKGKYDRWIMFAEKDIRPNPKMMIPWLESDGDIVCAKYKTETGENAWKGETPFHTGLWRIKADTLRKIGLPAFMPVFSPDGTTSIGCQCSFFAEKAKAMGMSIVVAGEAVHTPKIKDGLQDVFICGGEEKRLA